MDRILHAKTLQRTVGFIYFIECGDFIKIGYSVRPRERFRRIAAMSPVEMRLIGITAGGVYDERDAHTKFSHIRARNEWFHRTDDLLEWIRATCGNWSAVAVFKRTAKPKDAFEMLLDEVRGDPAKMKEAFTPSLRRTPKWDL